MTSWMTIQTATELRDRLTTAIEETSRSDADNIRLKVDGLYIDVNLTFEEQP